MINLYHIIVGLSLIFPIPLMIYIGKDIRGVDFPIFFGLLLQAILGNIILIYARGYEKSNLAKIFTGYLIFFGGLAGAYLSGKTYWLWFFWEISTCGALFIYTGHSFNIKAIRSIVALFLASGLSVVFISAWVFSPDLKLGIIFLTIGLLIKAAFSGMHIWLPEAHSGPPAHGSAAYSGLMINLPLLLFVKHVMPHWRVIPFSDYIVPVAGLGVLIGGISSFFSADAKKSLAYSTVENSNFLWLCLFIAGIWKSNENPSIANLGASFLVLFYFTLTHHSFSKIFQFLSVGYLCKVADSTNIDECKGIGRVTKIPPLLLGLGAFSFILVPGTTGFLVESILFLLNSRIMDLPTDKILYILPAVIFVLFGFAVGSAAHIRLFLPMTLSIPNERNLKKTSEPSSAINWSLGITGLFIFALPILISFLFLFQQPFKSLIPDYFSDWLWKIGGISIFMVIFYIAIVVYRFSHKISKRRLWDCGSNYAGSELSIASSVISDPLHSSIGTYFNDRSGEPFLDVKIISNLVKSLDFGRLWIDKVESGDLSNYIAFTSLSLLASVIFILSGFLV